jgi:hypothetical protein
MPESHKVGRRSDSGLPVNARVSTGRRAVSGTADSGMAWQCDKASRLERCARETRRIAWIHARSAAEHVWYLRLEERVSR